MFPILAGLGAACIAFAVMESDGKSGPEVTTTKPKTKPKTKKSSEPIETAAEAHARATRERDDHWKAELRKLKRSHKESMGALKDLFAAKNAASDQGGDDDDNKAPADPGEKE